MKTKSHRTRIKYSLNAKFHGVVKLPNDILSVVSDLNEQPTKAFLFILCLAQIRHTLKVTVKLSTIEKRCGLDDAERIIAELEQKHFLRKYNRVIAGKYASSIFVLGPQFENCLKLTEDYFFFPLDSLPKLRRTSVKLLIDHTQMSIYNNGECYSSLNQIARRTGLAKSTIIRNNKRLEELGFIIKKQYVSDKHEQLHRNNRYYVKHCIQRSIGHSGWQLLRRFLLSAGSSIGKYICAAIRNILTQGIGYAKNSIENLKQSYANEFNCPLKDKIQCAIRTFKAKTVSFIKTFTDSAYRAAQDLSRKLEQTFAAANKKAVNHLDSSNFTSLFFLKYGVVAF